MDGTSWQQSQAVVAHLREVESAEWGSRDDNGGLAMLLGERLKQLRKEVDWSQGELAERIGADARQISRYENGRITPSLDAVVRIAEVLNVSIDYLVVEDAPRRPLHAADHGLGDRLAALSELSAEDRGSLITVLDALVAKSRFKVLAGGLG